MKKKLLILSLLTTATILPLSELAQDYLELARSFQQKGNLEKAQTYYLKAINIDAQEIEPRFLLGNLYASQCNYEKAIEQYQAILASHDNVPTIIYNAAYCFKAQGRMQEALPLYEKAVKINPEHSDTHQGLSHCLLACGQYAAAWPHFEYRWAPLRKDSKKFIDYMHAGGSLAGKTVILRGEYGLGDTFQFIRYAQLVKEKGAKIILEAQKPLVTILSLCPYIDQVIPADSQLPAHDFSCPLMSLPYAFNSTLETIPTRMPYLSADAKLAQQWKTKLSSDNSLKVGLCWCGNVYDNKTLQDLVKEKSIPLELLKELSTIEGVSLYSLQKTSGLDQLKNMKSEFKITSYDTNFDESNGRFMDTAALMQSLDLVITIDTSIVHLAGGLGKKTWLMLPYAADWRWMMNRSDSPWYPNMLLFRQKELGNWKSVVNSISEALKKEVSTKKNMVQKIDAQPKKTESAPVATQPQFSPFNNLDLDTLDPNILAKRANDYYMQRDLPKSLEIYHKLALLIPTNPFIFYNVGKIFQETQQYRQAIEAYKKALAMKTDILPAYSGLGTCHLILSEMETAWPFWKKWFSMRDAVSPDAKPLWSGENLHGKRILIEDEGGFGDIFQWVRFAKMFKEKGAYVILETKASLIPILSSCKSIDQFVQKGALRPEHDVRVPFERIHCQANMTMETIPNATPYLYAKPELVQNWKSKLELDKNFKIGVCWSAQQFMNSATGKPFHNPRSIPLEVLAPLSLLDHVSVYSLQQANGLDQLSSLPAHFKIRTFDADFDKQNGRFMDTAATMMHMDLIITVDTSIAHLAGALGRPVWVLLPQACDWRWFLNRKDSPWYPTMRLFRQPEEGDWQSVMKDVNKKLTDELKKRFPDIVEKELPEPKKIEDKKYIAPVQQQASSSPQTTKSPEDNAPQALFQKGITHYNSGNLEGALEYFKKVHAVAPQELSNTYNLASTYRRLNLLPQAIETYKKVLEQTPNHHDASFGLAQAYLADGQIEAGWQLFNAYRPDIVKLCPTIEKLPGSTVLVRHEWGLGDVFHFIRYTKLLKSANVKKVIVETPSALTHILKLCPYIDEVVVKGSQLPSADYQIPLLYLPTLFRTSSQNTPAQIPYLHADASLIHEWRNRLKHDDNFKIGICWDIGHHDTNFVGWQRSVPLEYWQPFQSIKGISLYSLQKDCSEQLARSAKSLKIYDFGPQLDSQHGGFMDTAAIIKNVDLIITCDTSIAHLAGALGVPVWVLLPYSPDYRWTIQGHSTPWYPTMRLFRQPKSGDWNSVISEIVFELKKLLGRNDSPTFEHKQQPNEIAFDAISSAQMVDRLYGTHGKK